MSPRRSVTEKIMSLVISSSTFSNVISDIPADLTADLSPMQHVDTRLIHAGRAPSLYGGMVNTPVFRGSTIMANNLDDWEAGRQTDNPMAKYGRFGTPTTRSFEQAITTLEGGDHALVFP